MINYINKENIKDYIQTDKMPIPLMKYCISILKNKYKINIDTTIHQEFFISMNSKLSKKKKLKQYEIKHIINDLNKYSLNIDNWQLIIKSEDNPPSSDEKLAMSFFRENLMWQINRLNLDTRQVYIEAIDQLNNEYLVMNICYYIFLGLLVIILFRLIVAIYKKLYFYWQKLSNKIKSYYKSKYS